MSQQAFPRVCSKCFKDGDHQRYRIGGHPVCRGCQIDLDRTLGYLQIASGIDLAAVLFDEAVAVADSGRFATGDSAPTPPPPTEPAIRNGKVKADKLA